MGNILINKTKIFLVTFTFISCLFLSACGSGVEGTYSDEQGIIEYTFKSDGKVHFSTMGVETELTYKVDGDKVKIISPLGNQILTLVDDGSLKGPMGIKLIKRK